MAKAMREEIEKERNVSIIPAYLFFTREVRAIHVASDAF